MKRLVVIVSVAVIIGSAVVIFIMRDPGPDISDDALVQEVADTVLPAMVKRAARECTVPNATGSATLDLSLTFRTSRHGIEVSRAALAADAGTPPARTDCLLRALTSSPHEDPSLDFPRGREYALDIALPLPSADAAY